MCDIKIRNEGLLFRLTAESEKAKDFLFKAYERESLEVDNYMLSDMVETLEESGMVVNEAEQKIQA